MPLFFVLWFLFKLYKVSQSVQVEIQLQKPKETLVVRPRQGMVTKNETVSNVRRGKTFREYDVADISCVMSNVDDFNMKKGTYNYSIDPICGGTATCAIVIPGESRDPHVVKLLPVNMDSNL